MQQHQRRQDDGQPRRIERRNDAPVGKRTRQESERVCVFLDLGRWGAEPRAVREHVLAQCVLQPKPGSQQNAIAHRGKADEGRGGQGGDQRQQGQRLEAGGGNGALDDVQRIERQGQLQQARKAAQHEGRDKRAPHLLQ